MKIIFNNLISVFLVLGISSCSKFLEQSSQDLIRPVTIEHYKELLQGEAYFKDLYKNGWFIDMMTDDINALDLGFPTTNTNIKEEFVKFAYQWGADLEDPTGTFTDKLFQHLYKNILIANTCLENSDEASGTESQRQLLKGQAYFTRAYAYFVLVNLYAQAYNESTATDLGVPIISNTTPSLKGYRRGTIKEVWDLISSDIQLALDALDGQQIVSFYEINHKAALLLATRISLFKGDFEKTISYGEKFMESHPVLKDISKTSFTLSRTASTKDGKVFLYAVENPEVLFTFGRLPSAMLAEGSYLYYSNDAVGMAERTFAVSADVPLALIDLYEKGDKRKSLWFVQPSGAIGQSLTRPYYSPMKVSYYDLCRTSQYMRNAEVYLNLAEAYARQENPDETKALQLLNEVRRHRIENYKDISVGNFTDQQSLVNFIWQERRREMCFEEFHRWWDLRRTGQPPLEHTFGSNKYKLEKKDPAYILNFPKNERDFNQELVPNYRPDRPNN